MSGLILLRESTDEIEILNENTATGSKTYIEGPFISCNKKNRNGRIYEKQMMEGTVDNYIETYIKQKRSLGEFIHPDYPFPNPKKAAIFIESLEWRGDLVYGRAKVLDKMDDGRILKTLIEEGVKLGVSTRGMGVLKSDKTTVANYTMNAVDAVDFPSGQPCYVDMINESALWYPDGVGGWVLKNENGEIINEAKDEKEKSDLFYESFLERLEKSFHKKIYG